MKSKRLTVIELSPGHLLKEELKARDMSQSEFSNLSGISRSHLSEMIKGTRTVGKQSAAKFEEILGIPAADWVSMQVKYDAALKGLEQKNIEECEAEFAFQQYDNIIDMKLLMKMLKQNDYSKITQIQFCKEILHFGTPAEMACRCGAFHKSEKTGLDKRMINTWAIIARYNAASCPVQGTFKKDDLNALIPELVNILHKNNDIENEVKNTLSHYGIRFAVVPKLEKASIDGYAFFCDDDIPAIVVTKRIPRIDNFAFAIMHEVGHFKLHDVKNNPCISFSSDDEEAMETEANNFAAEALIPAIYWKETPQVIMNPVLIQKAYSEWASKNNLNKWIVLGRISHETGMYKFKNDSSREIN